MAERGEPAAPDPSRSWVTRIAAALALTAAIVAIVLIVGGSLGGDEEPAGKNGGKEARAEEPSTEETVSEETDEELPETYEVQSGDSLSTIADEHGISVERLERLNPDVDPAALATGQTLKLR